MEKFLKIISTKCPICEYNIKGNFKIGYFCKNCNLIFEEDNIKGNLFPNEDKNHNVFFKNQKF